MPKDYCDFRLSPKKEFWQFDNDVLSEVEDGSFIEVQVTMGKINIFSVINLKKQMKSVATTGDGEGFFV